MNDTEKLIWVQTYASYFAADPWRSDGSNAVLAADLAVDRYRTMTREGLVLGLGRGEHAERAWQTLQLVRGR